MRAIHEFESFQTAELRRVRPIARGKALDRATFTASDYGRRVRYIPEGTIGVLRVRFEHYPNNGTARFIPDALLTAPFHVTPDEVEFIRDAK